MTCQHDFKINAMAIPRCGKCGRLAIVPGWRCGQNAFNHLPPHIADQIVGTHADPFNNDGRIGAFMDWLRTNAPELLTETAAAAQEAVAETKGDV